MQQAIIWTKDDLITDTYIPQGLNELMMCHMSVVS